MAEMGLIMKKYQIKKILLLMIFISLTGCNKKTNSTDSNNTINNLVTEATSEQSLTNDKTIIENEIQNNNVEKASALAKDYFTNTIDFIFYNKEINGITFNELSTAEKEAVLNDLYTVDKEISAIDPTYKEDIGAKYNDFKNFTSETYNKVLDIIKNHMSIDTYNMIGDTKNSIVNGVKDNSKTLGKRLQNDAKKWYETNFKN